MKSVHWLGSNFGKARHETTIAAQVEGQVVAARNNARSANEGVVLLARIGEQIGAKAAWAKEIEIDAKRTGLITVDYTHEPIVTFAPRERGGAPDLAVLQNARFV